MATISSESLLYLQKYAFLSFANHEFCFLRTMFLNLSEKSLMGFKSPRDPPARSSPHATRKGQVFWILAVFPSPSLTSNSRRNCSYSVSTQMFPAKTILALSWVLSTWRSLAGHLGEPGESEVHPGSAGLNQRCRVTVSTSVTLYKWLNLLIFTCGVTKLNC